MRLFRPFKTPLLQPFALSGGIGYTGNSDYFEKKWYVEKLDLVTGDIGVHYFNRRFNTELSVRGVQFIAQDRGVRFDVVRHFKRVSLGLFAMKNNYGDLDGGFNLAVMLPP